MFGVCAWVGEKESKTSSATRGRAVAQGYSQCLASRTFQFQSPASPRKCPQMEGDVRDSSLRAASRTDNVYY